VVGTGDNRIVKAQVTITPRDGQCLFSGGERPEDVSMPRPLAPFAERYRLELLARGYTARSAVNESRQVA
jgi:hypothetical protein